MKKCIEQLRKMEKSLTSSKVDIGYIADAAENHSEFVAWQDAGCPGALRASGAKTQHKAIGVKTQDSWPPLEMTKEKEKESLAKAKVKMAEKASEKERATAKVRMAETEADGALQLYRRLEAEKEQTTACATTFGSGAILAKTAQFLIVEKLLDDLRRRPMKRRFSRRR